MQVLGRGHQLRHAGFPCEPGVEIERGSVQRGERVRRLLLVDGIAARPDEAHEPGQEPRQVRPADAERAVLLQQPARDLRQHPRRRRGHERGRGQHPRIAERRRPVVPRPLPIDQRDPCALLLEVRRAARPDHPRADDDDVRWTVRFTRHRALLENRTIRRLVPGGGAFCRSPARKTVGKIRTMRKEGGPSDACIDGIGRRMYRLPVVACDPTRLRGVIPDPVLPSPVSRPVEGVAAVPAEDSGRGAAALTAFA